MPSMSDSASFAEIGVATGGARGHVLTNSYRAGNGNYQDLRRKYGCQASQWIIITTAF